MIISQSFDGLGNPRRTHRDAFGRHAQPRISTDAVHRGEDLTVIEQRFAHPHINDVGQSLVVLFLGHGSDHFDLIVDLPSSQILQQLQSSGCAELASQAAPRLRRNASSHPLRSGNQYAFDNLTRPYIERTFDGAVVAELLISDVDAPQRELVVQSIAEPFAQVAHFFKRRSPFGPNPFLNLLGTKSLFAQPEDCLLQGS